ncbi:mitochondrial F1-F0 ATP synthase subunit F of fungi-domain-containing protein [Pisolithus croceorrhizus]|nr:mitochondrial F1-F0 ATP synthase subunit F of fungi-domain-containing protein [Pisolithus croceorrhizus]
MQSSLVRRQLGNLIPPKIATPKLVSAGSGEGLAPLVNFYSRLPKGPAPNLAGGLKAKYFNGKNASAAPAVWVILGLFTVGYTIDYQSSCIPTLFYSKVTYHFVSYVVHLSE